MKQPNRSSCLATAFANLLTLTGTPVSVQEIFDFCGHDGTQEVFKTGRPERSFHIQELIDFCDTLKKSVTEIQFNPVSTNGKEEFNPCTAHVSRFLYYISNYNGVLTGTIGGKLHAITLFDGLIYDPNGVVCHLYFSGSFLVKYSNQLEFYFEPDFFFIVK
jgi:hypothetical protein